MTTMKVLGPKETYEKFQLIQLLFLLFVTLHVNKTFLLHAFC